MLSSPAFRIMSSAPVVIYQLNALAQTYSNDGSLLLPRNGANVTTIYVPPVIK